MRNAVEVLPGGEYSPLKKDVLYMEKWYDAGSAAYD